jgi:KaiC/GvpD/RAD55 family RecA-like ATPase
VGESNAEWGALAEHDQTDAEQWDLYASLPEPGENPLLDAFCARKRITITGLRKLGAKLSADDTLAFGYSGGIKYRNMLNGQRWSSIGARFDELKVVPAGIEPTPVVLLAEGETDAARLADAYGVDVAVLPAGARAFGPKHADQLTSYQVVYVATDADEAGDAGADKVRTLVLQAQRFRPDGAKDWCALDALPPLPEPETRRTRIQFVGLGELVAGEIEPAVVLHDGVLIDNAVTVLAGHPGEGKTTLAQHQTFKAMQEGRTVIWLDWENGVRSYARRLQAVGAGFDLSREEIATLVEDHLLYAPFQQIAASPQGFELLAEAIELCAEPPIIVFDSLAKGLMQNGMSEDKNDDVTRWSVNLLLPAKAAGATVVVIDHVTKAADDKERYARGAGGKLSDVDGQWYVEAHSPFNRDVSGKLLLTNHKNREGVLAQRLAFSIGDGRGAIPILPISLDELDLEDPDAPSI